MFPRLIVIGIGLLILPEQAPAQSTSSAPPGAAFGGAGGSDRSRLDLTVELSEALDSEAPPELRRLVPETGPQSGGYSSMLVASAGYARHRRLLELDGTALTAFRYYPRLDQVSAVAHTGGLGATVHLPRSTSLEINQTAAYSPPYLYQLFLTAPSVPGDAVPAAVDYRVDDSSSYSYATRMRLAFGSDRGARFSITAERARTDFQGASLDRPDLDVSEGRASSSFAIGRSSRLTAEYVYRTGEFGFGGGTSTEHRVEIGGEYSRALSASRRALFRFNLAPSTLAVPESATAVAPGGTLYQLAADASVNYRFRRSWSFDGSFRRGLEYIAVLREPVFRDSARLAIAGLVSRRLDLSSSAGYVVGQSALNRNTESFDTYTGDVRARYALTRSVAVYSEYLYYYYDLRGQSSLAPDLPRVFEQHGVRVGLMLWFRPVGR